MTASNDSTQKQNERNKRETKTQGTKNRQLEYAWPV